MTFAFHDLTAGVVGTGFMGVAHSEALFRVGVRVKGIVGSTPDRARSKAETTNLPPVVNSYEALLADPEIDVIHITSPNYLHHAQVLAALEAGKHVICEKPLAVTVAEGQELVSRADASGLVHAVCFNQRYYPIVQQAREMTNRNELGEVRLVSGGYLQDWLLFDTDWNWRLVAEKGGALRAVADIGSHWLDNVEFTTGLRIVEVMADLHTFLRQRTHPVAEVESFAAHAVADDVARITEDMASDDAAGILLRFDNGARGVCTISQVSAGRKNHMSWEINGAKSSVQWCTESPDDLWIGHRGQPNQLLKRDPGLLHPAAAATVAYPGGHVEGYPDTFRAFFSAVYRKIVDERTGPKSPATFPTFVAGDRSLRICEALQTSAATGAWVSVAS